MQTLTTENKDQVDENNQEATRQKKQIDTFRSREDKSILIVFATRYGHTVTIVQQLANALKLLGHKTIVVRAGRNNPPTLETFAGGISCIILGGPLYMGRFSRALGDFIEKYRDVLAQKPNAFFSVSLAAANHDSNERNAAHEITEKFFDDNDWQPCRKASFAGALLYTHYGPLIRWFTRWKSRSTGGDIDIHRDYVYTDWNDIPVFAQAIDSMIKLAAEKPQ